MLTQNANEVFNHVIWKKCPKNIFVEKDQLETAVYSAIAEFHGGKIAIYEVIKQLGLKCEHFMINGAFAADKAKVLKNKEQSNKKSKRKKKKIESSKERIPRQIN